MISVNKVTIVGNLGNDPESQRFSNGGTIVKMNVATSERWKDKSTGEKRERTEWHKVVIQNPPAQEFIMNFAKKGDMVFIQGRLQTRKWTDANDIERYITEIVVPPFTGEVQLHSKNDRGGADRSGSGSQRDNGNRFGSGNYDGPLDDEIPF